ncbi:MAG TPA: XRE family transcriptional regulator [Nitrospirae bacterium]|nr:XRE family transcriptional regulator [Nitrospirota bacterium]
MKILKINKARVKAEMERQGLSYQDVGDKLHISRHAVGYYLYNRTRALSLRTISRLAWALNCDPKDLLI